MSNKIVKLEVQKRETLGKKQLKTIRNENGIPGIYYSFDSTSSISFTMDSSIFNEAVKSNSNLFSISVGGKDRTVVFKSVQYNPVTDQPIHIDLYGVKMDQIITVKVSISLLGTPKGVREEGGVLNNPTTEVEVNCLPLDIPNNIEVDISELSLGDALYISDIQLDEKLELASNPEVVLASVTHAMKEEEVVAEEEEEDFLEGEEGDAPDTTDSDEKADNLSSEPEDKED
tara:strand:+ start:77 stop:766 length:690 start_codon:yes stop_codon:yes gene_type:complete